MRARLPNKLPLRRLPFGISSDGDGARGAPPDTAPGSRVPRPGAAVAGLRDRRALGAVAAVVLIVIVVLIAGSGGEAAVPPATGAASVVPSDAIAYIHLSIDTSRPQVPSALALAGRFPGYPHLRGAALARLLVTHLLAGADFDRQIRPWLGKEAAIAILETGSSTTKALVVVAVSNERAAARYVAGLPTGSTVSYKGTTITRHPHAGDTAFVGHYLLIGHSSSIQAAIDVAAGRAPSLSQDPVYRRAAVSEPASRALDAYISGTGVTRLLTSRGGLVGAIAALIYQPALQGAAISLSPASGGIHVLVHSVLNRQLATSSSPPFTPSLPSSVPAGAALFLDAGRLDQILPRVLPAIGIGGRIPELLKRLGAALKAEGINVAQDIVPLFRRESAVVISTHGRTPVVTIITHTPNPAVTRTAFAQLETPLARLLSGGGGSATVQAPVFNQVRVGGITANQLVLSGLQLDYAVFNSNLVLSTNLAGIAGVARHATSIAGEPAYGATLGNHPARVTSLLFLDLNQLLSLGQQYGLVSGAALRALRPDLAQVHAIGLDSTSGEAQSTTELFLQIP